MNRKFSQIVAVCLVVLLCASSLSKNVAVARDNAVYPGDKLENNLSVIAETFSKADAQRELYGQKTQMQVQDVVITPDPYEPNDSIGEAYPYSNTTTLDSHPFTKGYKNANIHVEGDEDFFYINLVRNQTYDVVLKNLYEKARHIYLWKENNDGTWTRWRYKYQVDGQPEYYQFTPSDGGIYYIQIAGGEPEKDYYFFSVAKEGTVNTDLWP